MKDTGRTVRERAQGGFALRLFLFVVLGVLSFPASASNATEAVRGPEDVLGRQRLYDAIVLARSRVPEFVAIREQAKQLGLRVFLFGGTAAGFAAYVADDLLRQDGHSNYPTEHFAYLLPQLYRPGQDLDLVLDGPDPSGLAIHRLETRLAPFLPGSGAFRCGAECRWLTKPYGTKIALLGNEETMRQSTDSASIGFIELTDPPDGQPVVRDLHRWDDSAGAFLSTFAEGTVRYLPSPLHGTTARAIGGDNPGIIAVLRWLGKASQYRLRLHDDDLPIAKLEVSRFDPRDRMATSYARGQIEKVGTKMFKHAADVTRAYRIADLVGVRSKLAEVGSPNTPYSVAWWAMREPLPAFDVGLGGGLTAGHYSLNIVAHDATNLDAFESLLRAPTRVVNALQSRNVVGERAVHGNGFYVCRGTEGAWRTGFNVRFHVRPDAREGSDFKRINDDTYVILNREILTVIPDVLERDPLRFLELMPAFSDGDAGAVQRLFRGYRAVASLLDAPVRTAVLAKLEPELKRSPRSRYLHGFLDVLAEGPFTAEDIAPLLKATGGDPSVYQLVLRRALRAMTIEDAAPLREMLPSTPAERRQWARGIGHSLGDSIGVGARAMLLKLADEGVIPWRYRYGLLRRLATLRAFGESGVAWRWTPFHPILRSVSAWKAVAATALVAAALSQGAVTGFSEWRYYLGYPEYIEPGGYYTEARMRAKAREEGVPYVDYVKFAAPLGLGVFPSLPRELAISHFIPLLKSGDRAQIDRRAEIFRMLVEDYVTAHPFPEGSDRTTLDRYYQAWGVAVRTAAYLSLQGSTPLEDPRAALAFVEEVQRLGAADEWTVTTYYSSKSLGGASIDRCVDIWRVDRARALRMAKAVHKAHSTLELAYEGKAKLWKQIEREPDPFRYLEHLQALAKVPIGKDGARGRRWDWVAPDGEFIAPAVKLSMTEGVEKVTAIVQDADAEGYDTKPAVDHMMATSARPDWKAYVESRASARRSVTMIAESALGPSQAEYIQSKLRFFEPQHPCGEGLAVWGELARLSKVYPWGTKVAVADIDVILDRFAKEPQLSAFVDRFAIAARYAKTAELETDEARAICETAARRADVRDALAGHYSVTQVSEARLAGLAPADALALTRKAGRVAVASKQPIAFANQYRNALEARLGNGQKATKEIVEAAIADAKVLVP